VVDQPENRPPLPKDSEDPKESDSSKLRGLPEVSEPDKKPEEPEEPDQLDSIFKLHDQICSRMELAIASLHEIFPLIDQLSEKMAEGDNPEYRLDRRLRVPSLVQTIVAAHSHLGKAARSARLVSAIQKDELNEIRLAPFE